MVHSDRFIESYVHNGGIGVLVELRLSDSVVVGSTAFKTLAKDLALHIAAVAPTSVEDLLQQPFVKNPKMSVAHVVAQVAADLREKIVVLRFVRWVTDPPTPSESEPPRSPAVIHRLRSAG